MTDNKERGFRKTREGIVTSDKMLKTVVVRVDRLVKHQGYKRYIRKRAKFMATIPLGRFSTALDVANAALYLASDEGSFISGVCIEVDGARCV